MPNSKFKISFFISHFLFLNFAFTLSSGSFDVQVISGGRYKTLESANVVLRFDEALENKARKLLPVAQALLSDYQLKKNFTLNRKLTLYLVKNSFGNAFVSFPFLNPTHMVLPAELSIASSQNRLFMFAGSDGTPFDVFQHEVMHFIEVDQLFAPWSVIIGDGAYDLPHHPSWMMEAWAVLHEGGSNPYKGRMKPSYYGALFKSELASRDAKFPSRWDLSSQNPNWSLLGAHYITGANFYNYLDKNYGRKKLDDFVLKENGFSLNSSYVRSLGKSFSELFTDYKNTFNVETAKKSTEGASVVVLDKNIQKIDSLGMTSSQNLIFAGLQLNKTPKIYEHSLKLGTTTERDFFEWMSPFFERRSELPIDWSSASSSKGLYYFSAQLNQDGNEKVAGIYFYDLKENASRKVISIPGARAALVHPDGQSFITIVQKNKDRDVFDVYKGQLNAANTMLSIATITDFSDVSNLSWSEDRSRIYFSGIKAGQSWAFYELSLEASSAIPRLLVDTPGQDILGKLHKGKVYLLSDLNLSEGFQLYSLDGNKLCQVTQEPYLVKDFVFDENSNVYLSSRREGRDVIVRVTNLASKNCLVPATQKYEAAKSYETSNVETAFKESEWKGLLPNTRAILPSYHSRYGFAYDALLSGEGPYKDWSWSLMGRWQDEFPRDYLVGATLELRQFFPYVLTLDSLYSPHVMGSFFMSEAHFLTNSIELERKFGLHELTLRAAHSTQVDSRLSPSEDIGEAFSFGLAHEFENTTSSVLAVAPQRGWTSYIAAEHFPSYFQGTVPRTRLFAEQSVFLPITESFFPTHSFSLNFSELKSWNALSYAEGFQQGYRYESLAESELTQNPRLNGLTRSDLSIRGYSDTYYDGDLALKASVEYVFPLNFLQYGIPQLIGRRYLSPESSVPKITLFYDACDIRGMEESYYGFESKILHSTGFQASWSLWTNETHRTGVLATYTYAKELTDDKDVDQSIDLTAKFVF